MNLEDIMLNEMSVAKKTTIVWFHLYEEPKVVKFIETKSRMVDAGGWREREMDIAI